MSTPTIGELERRIADLEARGEEGDERMGLADGTQDEDVERNEATEAAHTINGRTAREVARYYDYVVYEDDAGNYWLVCALKGPVNVRELADKIEEVEQ